MSMDSFHARAGRRPPVRRAADAAVARRGGQRADALLVARGLAPSRTAAQRLIAAGRVEGPHGRILKPAQELPDDAPLNVAAGATRDYVSRGGEKLAGALATSGIDVRGRLCLDVGQSTGGFTDCLLSAGAARVVGVDVGHGQLHARLAADARVRAHAGINARQLSAADLGDDLPPEGFFCIVADLSFISLTLVLPRLVPLLAADGQMLLLVKPQFEVGPAGLGKGGIVRDPARYAEVEQKIRVCADRLGLAVLGWFPSPITGGDGNREFFLWSRHAS